jgi:hypothetical protein
MFSSDVVHYHAIIKYTVRKILKLGSRRVCRQVSGVHLQSANALLYDALVYYYLQIEKCQTVVWKIFFRPHQFQGDTMTWMGELCIPTPIAKATIGPYIAPQKVTLLML